LKKLRGLMFKSDSGNKYYYDDCSSMCYHCSDDLANTIHESSQLTYKQIHDKEEHSYWEKFMLKRYDKYGAFWGTMFENGVPDHVKVNDVKSELELARLRMLYLIVTSECNLRCRYCVYSDHYDGADFSSDEMSWDTAKKAVDMFHEMILKKRERSPEQKMMITFYGGEPLIKMPLIKQVVDYAKSIDDNSSFSLSTNGVLMNDEVIDFLIENEFSIAVSIDGPREQHNRNRVFMNGEGSFDIVYNNIKSLWERYPDYDKIIYLITYDCASDIEAIHNFFSDDNFDKGTLFVSKVKDTFTDYYQQFNTEQVLNYMENNRKLRDKLFSDSDSDDNFTSTMATSAYQMFLMRKLFGKTRGNLIPATASCIPCEKICVLPDGNFQVCDRVPGLKNLGSVDEGINYENVANLIDKYNEVIVKECEDCPISRLCSFCFMDFWSGKELKKPSDSYCSDRVASVKTMLEQLYSLLEVNPELIDKLTDFSVEKLKQLQTVVS